MNQKYTERVNAFLRPYLEKEGYELILTEFTEENHSRYLRVYIELSEAEQRARAARLSEETEDGRLQESEAEAKEALSEEAPEETADREASSEQEEPLVPAVSIDDCVKVSRRLSQWLDKEDFIQEEYMLEVCSRGFLNPETAAE